MFVTGTVHTGNVIRASNFACALPLTTMRSIQLVYVLPEIFQLVSCHDYVDSLCFPEMHCIHLVIDTYHTQVQNG